MYFHSSLNGAVVISNTITSFENKKVVYGFFQIYYKNIKIYNKIS